MPLAEVSATAIRTAPPERVAAAPSARQLLADARRLWDAPDSPLPAAARQVRFGGFVGGAEWMRLALHQIRGSNPSGSAASPNRYGFIKYGLALAAAVVCGTVLLSLGFRWVAPLGVVVAFYAIEAQMVFLFPLLLDGTGRPFQAARQWTARAGGTITVMSRVMPLAAVMLLGGLAGGGFLRSWCLGCLAVCVWYERLRNENVLIGTGAGASPVTIASCQCTGARDTKSRSGRFVFEIGAARPLHIRQERVTVQSGSSTIAARPALRLLYVSDLHLGNRWSGFVAAEIVRAAKESIPGLILLGGDLCDHASGLPRLGHLIESLVEVAPVWAIAGNHDARAGVQRIRRTVESAGGGWLGSASLRFPRQNGSPICVDGSLRHEALSADCRILCAHDPAIFPRAVAAGYDLVLAGHLHGGQCVLFTRGPRLYPGAWFSKWHVTRLQTDRTTLLVSRGAADTLPLRFNCPREVILCDIHI